MSTGSDLIPAGLRRTFSRMRRMREQVRTELVLGALPDHIRKDIGWPDRFAEQRLRDGR
jgi:hypothetical protein